MFKLLSNKQKISKPVKKLFNGINHYVFPAVIAKTGVMNNVLYPADVLANTADLWNGVKVTLRHPTFNGNNTSINNASISDKFSIGELYNVTFEEDKLKGDIYINEASITAKNAFYLIDWLNNGKNIDVSTGLDKAIVTNQSGEFNGKKYDVILNSFKADHVAILPDETGACSVADGCGTLFNSDFSHSDLRQLIYTALGNTDGYIEDVYDDYFIFSNNDSMIKYSYSIMDNKVVIGEFNKVVKKTEYVISNKQHCECEKINNQKGSFFPMKEKTIKFLSNAELTGISEDDKKAFDSLSDSVIDTLVNAIKKEDNFDKIFITNAEKVEFEAFKQDKVEKETALRNEFKQLFNADDAMIKDIPISSIEHLVNQKKSEKPTEKQVDYSGRGSLNNNEQGEKILTNKEQIAQYAEFLKGDK